MTESLLLSALLCLFNYFDHRMWALVQWLMLPVWKFEDRGFDYRSGIKVCTDSKNNVK